MAEPTTWTELKANIADWLNRDDLTTQIPEFIGYAERRFNRTLRVPEMESDVTASSSGALITLPTDFLAMRSLYINGTNQLTMLRQMELGDLRAKYSAEETGTPAFFALQNGNELVLAPAPTSSLAYVLNYWKKIPALGASVADNWLLLAHPDIYRSATLAEAYLFLRDNDGASMWEAKTSAALEELTTAGYRKANARNRAGLTSDLPSIQSFNINNG